MEKMIEVRLDSRECVPINEVQLLRNMISENGTTIERLRELVDADRNGRCWISRVKIGDTVWIVTNKYGCRGMGKEIVECHVTNIRLKSDGTDLIFSCKGRYCNGLGNYYQGNFNQNSIGKSVFLSHEVARAVLERVRK